MPKNRSGIPPNQFTEELTPIWPDSGRRRGLHCFGRATSQAPLEAIADHCPAEEDAKQAFGYSNRNRARMRYQAFRDDKLCVSSGMVETSCRNSIGARLKRSGMRWSVTDANKIAALHSCILSNRYEGCWYERIANR